MKKYCILFCFSLVLTVIIYLPFSLNIIHALPNSIDPLFYAWNFMHNTQSFLNGGKNLLDTNIFFPEPNTLAFSDTLFGQMPITFPIIILTKNPILAENIYIFLTFPLSAIAMYGLLYYLTKNNLASWLSSLFYAFSYPRLSQIGHIPALSSQWIPLFILFLLKYLSKGKFKDLILMLVFYLLSLTSTIYFGVFIIFPTIIITISYVWYWWKTKQLKILGDRLRKATIIFIPFCVIVFVSIYPYIRLRAENPDIKRSISDTQYLKAHMIDYITVLPTSILGKLGLPKRIDEHVLYPTLTLTVLAGIGLVIALKKRRRIYFVFFLIGLVVFLLSFGPYQELQFGSNVFTLTLPYYYLYSLFPPLQVVRVPARFSIFVILSLSVLSGFALANIKYKNRYMVYGLIFFAFLLEVWQFNTPYVTVPTKDNLPSVYQWLIGVSGDPIIAELPLKSIYKGVLMEEQLLLPYSQLTENQVYALETYRTYFSGFHGKRMLNGYSGFLPTVYHDNAKYMETFPNDDVLYAFKSRRVGYIIIHTWQYKETSWEEVKQRIQEYKDLRLVKQFGDDYVYEINYQL